MTPADARACDRDPLKYANRPLEREFDAYASLREMLAKLNASVKGGA